MIDRTRTLRSALRRHASHRAERPFLIDAATGKTFSYADVDRIACHYASRLADRGLRREDRAAIVLDNSPEFALLYFGCAYLGLTVVPVSPRLNVNEIEYILAASRPSVAIVSEARASGIPAGIPVWPLGKEEFAGISAAPAPETLPADETTWDDHFCITFTSGTTGTPKGVVHRAASLFGSAGAFNQQLGFNDATRLLHVMPMTYMAGILNTLICPFVAGGSAVLAPQMDALTLLRFWKPVVRHAVNTLWIVPTALASLLRCDRDAGGAEYCRRCIRTVCVGTAPLQTATKLAFEERYGVELLESYGLSELLFISSNATAFARKPGSVGRVLPGVEVAFGAADGDGAIGGEIRVRTPWLMDGYLDEQTSRPLRPSGDGWFPTGDLGVLDEDGDLFITGRIKDLIVRGGFNVSPRAVEAVLLSHEAVDQAAVVGVPHEFYGEEVTAALVLRDGRSLAADRPGIEAFCRGRLSAHAVPTRYVELDALPANAQGKILKRDLRARLSALAASSHA